MIVVIERNVLVADDDPEMRSVIVAALEFEGYRVIEAHSGAAVLRRIKDSGKLGGVKIDLIISDNRMPDITGLEILKYSSHLQIRAPIILITAFGSEWFAESAIQFGAAAVLSKPFELETLVNMVIEQIGARA